MYLVYKNGLLNYIYLFIQYFRDLMSYDFLILYRNIVKMCKELQFLGGLFEFVQIRCCKFMVKLDWEKEREMIDV